VSKIYVTPLGALAATLKISRCSNMICLMGPGKTPPRPAQLTDQYLALEFHDIAVAQDGCSLASIAQIKQLIEFFRSLDPAHDVVIHCWMGISRSTAAAAIGCAAINSSLTAETIAQALRYASPVATPNPHMIMLADGLLNMNGSLITQIAKIGRGDEAREGIPFILDPHKLSL